MKQIFLLFCVLAVSVLAIGPDAAAPFDFHALLVNPDGCRLAAIRLAGDLHVAYFKGFRGPEVPHPDMSKVNLEKAVEHLKTLSLLVRKGRLPEIREFFSKPEVQSDLNVDFEYHNITITSDWRGFFRHDTPSQAEKWQLLHTNTSYIPYITYAMRTSFPSRFNGNPSKKNLLHLPGHLMVDLYKEGEGTPSANYLNPKSAEAFGLQLSLGMLPSDLAFFEKTLCFASWEETYHHADFVHWLRTGKSLSPITQRFFDKIGVKYDFYLHSELAVLAAAKFEYGLLDDPSLLDVIQKYRYRYPIYHLRALIDSKEMAEAVREQK